MQLLPLPLTQKVSRVSLSTIISIAAYASTSTQASFDFPGSQIRFATHSGMVDRLRGRENLSSSFLLLPSLCSFDGTSHLHCSFRQMLPLAFATASISYRPIRVPRLASFILSLIRIGYSPVAQAHLTQ